MKVSISSWPWEVDVDVRGKHREFISDKDGRTIAYVFAGPKQRENSTLMAMAPRMLEALVSAYKGDIDEPWQLRNIIEAATGKTIEEILD